MAKGNLAGAKARTATCSMTTESLPPENKMTGRSKHAATSRIMVMASSSRPVIPGRIPKSYQFSRVSTDFPYVAHFTAVRFPRG